MSECCASEIASVGGIVAMFLSYYKWHSIGYAILHFCCGWFYVIYHIFTYGFPHIRSY